MGRLSRRALLRLAVVLRRLPAAMLPPLLSSLLSRKTALHRARSGSDRLSLRSADCVLSFFLDRDLVYSCAYFDRDVTQFTRSAAREVDYSLRKLRIKPGERLLDIGCGWGALVVRAAQEFGAYVLGVTLSRSQSEEARRRIRSAGIEDRARVESWDYRELPATTFDKVVSIGMFEHVGRERLPQYFATAYRLLKSGGLFSITG